VTLLQQVVDRAFAAREHVRAITSRALALEHHVRLSHRTHQPSCRGHRQSRHLREHHMRISR
jgi:hypothetical protein